MGGGGSSHVSGEAGGTPKIETERKTAQALPGPDPKVKNFDLVFLKISFLYQKSWSTKFNVSNLPKMGAWTFLRLRSGGNWPEIMVTKLGHNLFHDVVSIFV